jgi:hypothetical protein
MDKLLPSSTIKYRGLSMEERRIIMGQRDKLNAPTQHTIERADIFSAMGRHHTSNRVSGDAKLALGKGIAVLSQQHTLN